MFHGNLQSFSIFHSFCIRSFIHPFIHSFIYSFFSSLPRNFFDDSFSPSSYFTSNSEGHLVEKLEKEEEQEEERERRPNDELDQGNIQFQPKTRSIYTETVVDPDAASAPACSDQVDSLSTNSSSASATSIQFETYSASTKTELEPNDASSLIKAPSSFGVDNDISSGAIDDNLRERIDVNDGDVILSEEDVSSNSSSGGGENVRSSSRSSSKYIGTKNAKRVDGISDSRSAKDATKVSDSDRSSPMLTRSRSEDSSEDSSSAVNHPHHPYTSGEGARASSSGGDSAASASSAASLNHYHRQHQNHHQQNDHVHNYLRDSPGALPPSPGFHHQHQRHYYQDPQHRSAPGYDLHDDAFGEGGIGIGGGVGFGAAFRPSSGDASPSKRVSFPSFPATAMQRRTSSGCESDGNYFFGGGNGYEWG